MAVDDGRGALHRAVDEVLLFLPPCIFGHECADDAYCRAYGDNRQRRLQYGARTRQELRPRYGELLLCGKSRKLVGHGRCLLRRVRRRAVQLGQVLPYLLRACSRRSDNGQQRACGCRQQSSACGRQAEAVVGLGEILGGVACDVGYTGENRCQSVAECGRGVLAGVLDSGD